MNNTKKWEKPKLIILLRDRPEEAVLGTCKAGQFNVNPASNVVACAKYCLATCVNLVGS